MLVTFDANGSAQVFECSGCRDNHNDVEVFVEPESGRLIFYCPTSGRRRPISKKSVRHEKASRNRPGVGGPNLDPCG
jgi:hypothetical protein